MTELDRGQFLRMGAGGLAAVTASALLPAAARAQDPAAAPPPPPPDDDGVAFLTFAAVAERASRDFYRAALSQRATGLSAAERRHMDLVAGAKRAHIRRLDAALGADAPLPGDFETVLPPGAVKTRARILAFGAQLETLLVRVYVGGAGSDAAAATRVLLGRLLAYDAQALTWLQVAAGRATPVGMPSPLDLEPAGALLDKFLSTPDFPD